VESGIVTFCQQAKHAEGQRRSMKKPVKVYYLEDCVYVQPNTHENAASWSSGALTMMSQT